MGMRSPHFNPLFSNSITTFIHSWVDGSPVCTARDQGTYLRRTRLRILRIDHPTREIPAQERHLALPSLRIIPERPQTFGTVVRDQGFGFIITVGVLYIFPDALLTVSRKSIYA